MECKGDYGFEMIAADEIQEIIHKERTMLIDLRSVEYYQNGHIENARNFPYEYIGEWQREIPSVISLILYCFDSFSAAEKSLTQLFLKDKIVI